MSNSESGNTGKLIGALLVGAAIGAALGILFAPGKGDDTRKKIFDKAKDLADDLTGKIKETMGDKNGFADPENEHPV
jgi:gas vesicle protein